MQDRIHIESWNKRSDWQVASGIYGIASAERNNTELRILPAKVIEGKNIANYTAEMQEEIGQGESVYEVYFNAIGSKEAATAKFEEQYDDQGYPHPEESSELETMDDSPEGVLIKKLLTR